MLINKIKLVKLKKIKKLNRFRVGEDLELLHSICLF
jgi:hypothetical protein